MLQYCSHPAVTASHTAIIYIDVHGVWHIQGASYNESHYTVWTAWISVELIKVRVDFVFQSSVLLISAQSQCMAANTSGL